MSTETWAAGNCLDEQVNARNVVTATSRSAARRPVRPRCRICYYMRLQYSTKHECFFGVYEARQKSNRPSLVYYGDDGHAKTVAAQLIRDVGFEPIDLGPLRMGRYAERFSLLMAQLAYEGAEGPEVAYRFEWFKT